MDVSSQASFVTHLNQCPILAGLTGPSGFQTAIKRELCLPVVISGLRDAVLATYSSKTLTGHWHGFSGKEGRTASNRGHFVWIWLGSDNKLTSITLRYRLLISSATKSKHLFTFVRVESTETLCINCNQEVSRSISGTLLCPKLHYT